MYPKIWGPTGWGMHTEFINSTYQHIKNIKLLRKSNRFFSKVEDDYIDTDISVSRKKLVDELDFYSIKHAKIALLTYIKLFPLIIPCIKCSNDSKNYVKKNPFPINDLEEWIPWLHKFKSYVNRKTGMETSLALEEFKLRIDYFSSISAINIFKLLLIVGANLDQMHDSEMSSVDIKEMYRRMQLLFASMHVLCLFSPSLITAAPFMLMKDWIPRGQLNDLSLFKSIYKNARNYEIETQSVAFLKFERDIRSAQVNKSDYYPVIFEGNEKSCYKKYRYEV